MRRLVHRPRRLIVFAAILCIAAFGYRVNHALSAQSRMTLSAAFTRQVLATSAEAPFSLRFFTTAVKTDSRGRIITGPTDDPVKNLVGAEFAGERAGQFRFTKILFGANYFDGRPDASTRIDPGDPQVSSGNQRQRMATQDDAGAWIAARSRVWLEYWRAEIGRSGFYPFDAMAIAHVVMPALFRCATVDAWVGKDPKLFLPFTRPEALLVEQHGTADRGRRMLYCPDVESSLGRQWRTWFVGGMAE